MQFVNATSGPDALSLLATGQAVATNIAPLSASGYADLDHDTYTLDVRGTLPIMQFMAARGILKHTPQSASDYLLGDAGNGAS